MWNYSTGETHLVGALVSAAVKRPVAQYLSQKIWSKFGMESDATWWLESPGGLEVGGSGLSATLRDYGRFGVFVLNGGVAGKERVVPQGWFSEAGSPKRVGNQFVNYGYMWWIADSSGASIHQGAFEAIGIFGQAADWFAGRFAGRVLLPVLARYRGRRALFITFCRVFEVR